MKRKSTLLVASLAVAAAWSGSLLANEGAAMRGWHFYEEVVTEPEEEPEKPEPALTPIPAVGELKAKPATDLFSTAWFQKFLPVLRARAIDEPTETNVKAYKYAERVMMDKSSNFAVVSASLGQTDPFLNENVRRPLNQAANIASISRAAKAQDEVIEQIKDESGLWVFFDEKCTHCVAGLPALRVLAQKTKLSVTLLMRRPEALDPDTVKPLVVKRDAGHSKELKVKLWPTYILVVPPKTFAVIGQGALQTDEMKSRIVMAAIDSGLVDKSFLDQVKPTRKGILTQDEILAMESELTSDDPLVMIEYLQRMTAAEEVTNDEIR